MTFQIGRSSMLPVIALSGLMVIFLQVQGQLPAIDITDPAKMNFLAELAIYESLGVSGTCNCSIFEFAKAYEWNDPPPDYSTQVVFRAYDRTNIATGGVPITLDSSSLEKHLKPGVPTKIFVHGWITNSNSAVSVLILGEYAKCDNLNIIFVDWSCLADTIDYPEARCYTPGVARQLALLLNALEYYNISTSIDQHIVGHSLGAHIAGMAAGSAKRKPGRVTGLDPAFPLFELSTNKGRIDCSNADLVDVIHTTAGFWGFPGPLGHLDFYPNGGVWPQPGCGPDPTGFCSHVMAVRFFAYTIHHDQAFMAHRCQTHKIVDGRCPASTKTTPMGEHLNCSADHGMYCVQAELPPDELQQGGLVGAVPIGGIEGCRRSAAGVGGSLPSYPVVGTVTGLFGGLAGGKAVL